MMLDKIKGFFSAGNNYPTHAQLSETVAKSGYSGHALKMLAHTPLIKLSWKNMGNDVYASLLNNRFTGNIDELQLNKSLIGTYKMSAALVHEGYHFDQASFLGLAYSKLYQKPQDAYKQQRLVEIEAYGGESFKTLSDFIEDKINLEEFSGRMEESVILGAMTASYAAKPMPKTPKDGLDIAKQLKDRKIIRTELEALPRFYLTVSEMTSFMDNESDNTIQQLQQIFSSPERYVHKGQTYNPELAPFSYSFGPQEADALLKRNGLDILGRLNSKDRETFWKNICSLEKHDRQFIEQCKEKSLQFVSK